MAVSFLNPFHNYKMVRYERSSLSGKDDLDAEEGNNVDSKTGDKVLDIETENANHVKFHMPSRKVQRLWKDRQLLEKILIVICILLLIAVFIVSILLIHVWSKGDEVCLSETCILIASSILPAMDKTVDPCDDFYQYACGNWMKENPGPEGSSQWNMFHLLWNQNQIVMRKVLESELNTTSTAELKVQAYYTSCLDEDKVIEELGGTPLLNGIEELGGWNVTGTARSDVTMQSIIEKLGYYYVEQPFFTLFVDADDKSSNKNIIQIAPPVVLLPDAQYMLNKSEDDELLQAYRKYMRTITQLLGAPQNEETNRQLEEILQFGIALANVTYNDDQLDSDPEKLYNRMTIKELQKISPAIDWLSFIKYTFQGVESVTITEKENLIIFEPDLMADLSELLLNTDEELVKNYMIWKFVAMFVGFLSEDFRQADDDFQSVLSGAKDSQPKWRTCITDTDEALGFALGALFVKESFQGGSKEIAAEMVEKVRSAFKRNLPDLDWMDEETRTAAKQKANAILDLIGFPNFILDEEKLDKFYEEVDINATAYFRNSVEVLRFMYQSQVEGLRKATDRGVWEMNPATVNAYYQPIKNEIVFPAGILQAPFYDRDFPKSLNFGGIGVVMGHEITHAFDDKGRGYDKYGNLNQWWNNETIERFEEQTQCFVEQYSKYKVDNKNVEGRKTLGENIADNGGLKSAFLAYEEWVHENGNEKALPGVGLTSKQLFFLGFAQVWCSFSTPEEALLHIMTDHHSPPRFRVIGTLSNSEDFAREFQCPADAPMNPEKKCVVW
ncbi:endothelin-converting enzyme 1-like isoform X1 [Apostichopus japonicus]|uniref:endothelin-converting enzyme 1-like isoform X1 n=2 Tax=Stichopus japonicus TaxID=307972 RepID=UPI003AB4F0C1